MSTCSEQQVVDDFGFVEVRVVDNATAAPAPKRVEDMTLEELKAASSVALAHTLKRRSDAASCTAAREGDDRALAVELLRQHHCGADRTIEHALRQSSDSLAERASSSLLDRQAVAVIVESVPRPSSSSSSLSCAGGDAGAAPAWLLKLGPAEQHEFREALRKSGIVV